MKHRAITLAALLSSIALLTSGATAPVAAQGPAADGPFFGATVTPRSFDGDLRNILPVRASAAPRIFPRYTGPVSSFAEAPDPVVQTVSPIGQMPSPNLTFKGLTAAEGLGWPPDPNGDVGPNHYLQAVNTAIGIFNKSGTRLAELDFASFWSAAGGTGTPCDNGYRTDPIVLYDPIANRWVITIVGFAFISGNLQPPYYECIAVSKSGDPVSGGWWFYPIQTDVGAFSADFSDYPKLGVWPDAYYMSASMIKGSVFKGSRVWAFDHSKMINGQMLTPVYFDLPCAATCSIQTPWSLLPANLRGALPPAGTPDYFAAIDFPSTNTLHVWKFHFDPTTPSNSWFGTSSSNVSPVNIPVAAFAEQCTTPNPNQVNCIPEKGAPSSQYLDDVSNRLMMQLQYRNIGGTESLWAAHTASNSTLSSSLTGIRWYQLDVTGGNVATTPVQQSTFKPDSNFRWLPSLAVDKFGNMAVGYSISSSTMYPSIRYAGRLAGDPLNTLAQGEATLFSGSGAQTIYPNGVPINRWGDYSAMTVDPTDDCTFWYTNEYYATSGFDWQTRIGFFRFPVCGPAGPSIVQENAPNVQYDGWHGVVDGNASGGSYRVSDTANDKVTFKFTGTSVNWIHTTGPDEGNALVTIDGINRGTLNLYSATPHYQVSKVYGGLTFASHTIAIKVLGTHDPSATDSKVSVDAFIVGGTTTQDTDKAIQYNTWIGSSNAAASGGTWRQSSKLGDVARFTFTGKSVTWLTIKGPGYGKAEVFCDGSNFETVDLYSASVHQLAVSCPASLLPGPRTLEIHVLHTKNPAATGYNVAVDAFVVTFQ